VATVGQVLKPPREADFKREQNDQQHEYFKRKKKIFLCSKHFKLLGNIKQNSIKGVIILNFVISVRSDPCDCFPLASKP
jgi:hypothetical protein